MTPNLKYKTIIHNLIISWHRPKRVYPWIDHDDGVGTAPRRSVLPTDQRTRPRGIAMIVTSSPSDDSDATTNGEIFPAALAPLVRTCACARSRRGIRH
jgi:hypothetical protein